MKRLRSGGLFSGYLLHCLHSGHVSRGHRSSLTKNGPCFFFFWVGLQKIGQVFSIKRCELAKERAEGDRREDWEYKNGNGRKKRIK